MRVRLKFERVYGTSSRFGENPRESPPGSPIVLDDYPLAGERLTIHLGQPVEELYRIRQVARAGASTLLRRIFIIEDITAADEAAALQQAQTEPLRDDLTRWNWYITILIERTIEVPDTQYIPARWFSIDPSLAVPIEGEFLTYGSFQADFIVDHLTTLVPKHFFATRDVDDHVVFVPENGAPFRIPRFTGHASGSTSSPMHLCNVDQIRAAMLDIKREGQLAFSPLTPATLLTLMERVTTSDLKGRVLEELVSKLFLTIPGLRVLTRIRTATEEIDIGIFNDTAEGFLASEGAVILAECKNWSDKCGRDEFSLLETKAENRRQRCSLSFLFSWNGFTGTIDKELLRSSRQRLVIVPLTGSDLKRAVAENNFVEVIESAWRDAVFT